MKKKVERKRKKNEKNIKNNFLSVDDIFFLFFNKSQNLILKINQNIRGKSFAIFCYMLVYGVDMSCNQSNSSCRGTHWGW